MTYNIRNARGVDDRVDLARIARVIAPFAPHVVALQEVDVARVRSGSVDQAATLASELGMTATFTACIERGCERYGIATLSRLPLVDMHELQLPHRDGRNAKPREPRRALWTRYTFEGTAIDIVNTHLSVHGSERGAQVASIVDRLDEQRAPHVIVAGDFNCTPWSSPFRALACQLVPATRARTWPSRLPIVPIDHILLRGFDVVRAGAWTATDARRASDHLPVFAELAVAGAAGVA